MFVDTLQSSLEYTHFPLIKVQRCDLSRFLSLTLLPLFLFDGLDIFRVAEKHASLRVKAQPTTGKGKVRESSSKTNALTLWSVNLNFDWLSIFTIELNSVASRY